MREHYITAYLAAKLEQEQKKHARTRRKLAAMYWLARKMSKAMGQANIAIVHERNDLKAFGFLNPVLCQAHDAIKEVRGIK